MTCSITRNADKRRSLRLKGYDYRSTGAYFVTIVTRGRVCRFGDIVDRRMILTEAGRMVLDVWETTVARFSSARSDAFVVMPNHIHGVVYIDSDCRDTSASLAAIVGAFKSTTTVQYVGGVRSRGWPPFQDALWQRNYFEHIIRTEKDHTSIREYIANNPGQWDEDDENPTRTVPAHGTAIPEPAGPANGFRFTNRNPGMPRSQMSSRPGVDDET